MNKYTLKINTLQGWNETISSFQDAHFLLSTQWAEIKSGVGWEALPLIWVDEKKDVAACALILEKRLRIGSINLPYSILYAPKGPLVDWENEELIRQVFFDLEKLAKNKKSIFIKIDPDVILGRIFAQNETFEKNDLGENIKRFLLDRHWNFSTDQIQFRNTVWIDLTKNEEQLLTEMKQKTRYNIRLAIKKGVTIRSANISELNEIYKIYAQTAFRDGFTIRNEQYYLNVWKLFLENNMCEVLVAEVERNITAGLVLFYFGKKAYYVYGMSTNAYRNTMSTYLIQWEAMLRAKQKGLEIYDMWGAPDILSEDDPMWGVYRFKRGLGGDFISTIGAWDYVNKPNLMNLYGLFIPWFLKMLRKIGSRATKKSIIEVQ